MLVPLNLNNQQMLNLNPYIINVWNCYFEKKITRSESILKFLSENEINTTAQYTNFTILKLLLSSKVISKEKVSILYLLKIPIVLYILIIMNLIKLILS